MSQSPKTPSSQAVAGAFAEHDLSLLNSPAYYETVYGDYSRQNPPYKYDHYVDSLLQFRTFDAPKQFSHLDFGCANGRFLNHIRQRLNLQIQYGVDINEAAVEVARQQLPQVTLRAGTSEVLKDLPTVDVITALDVLEHIPDLTTAVQNLSEQLNPGGLLLAVVPVYDGPLGPLVHLLDKDPTHVHKRSRQFWVDIFQFQMRQSLELLHWHGILRWLPPVGNYIHHPTKAFRDITPAILLIARKRDI